MRPVFGVHITTAAVLLFLEIDFAKKGLFLPIDFFLDGGHFTIKVIYKSLVLNASQINLDIKEGTADSGPSVHRSHGTVRDSIGVTARNDHISQLTTVNEKLENAKSSAYELGADKSIDQIGRAHV